MRKLACFPAFLALHFASLRARAKQITMAALACVGLAAGGTAQATATYTYTGAAYAQQLNHTAGNCTAVGGCSDYSNALHITGSFIVSSRLAPNLNPQTHITPVAYMFTDGINTISSADPGARFLRIQVGTDASGVITSWSINVMLWRDHLPANPAAPGVLATGPHGAIAANATTSTGRFDDIDLESTANNGSYDNAFNDLYCGNYPSADLSVTTPDTCDGVGIDSFLSVGATTSAGVWTFTPTAGTPIFGAAAQLTSRDCTGLASNVDCSTRTRTNNQLLGGPAQGLPSVSLNLSDGSFATGAVAFNSQLALPQLSGSSGSSSTQRMGSNMAAYQSYTLAPTAQAQPLSFQANLHIVNSSGAPNGGNLPGGAIANASVAIWDPSIIPTLNTASDIINNVFSQTCATPGVLAIGTATTPLTGGEQFVSVTTVSCSGSPFVIQPGQEVVAVAFLQLLTNRGGFVDATHTFTVQLDPTLPPAVQTALVQNLQPAQNALAVPALSNWMMAILALMLGGVAIWVSRNRQSA